MRVSLTPHPDMPSTAVGGIFVEVARDRRQRLQRGSRSMLILRYMLELHRDGLRLPAPSSPERSDALWEHTCFEAFVRLRGDAYCEFNFSPSTQWAAYRFSSYRKGMTPLVIEAPVIAAISGRPPHFEQRVSLDLESEDDLRDAPWRLALTAVIEEASGVKSYWALKHPPGKPDFHHADGFVLELP